MSVPLEFQQDTAKGRERAEAVAKGIAHREAGDSWRVAAAKVDLPHASLRDAYKRVKSYPDHQTMMANMRKEVEENFSAILTTGSLQLARKLEEEEIKAKDLAVIMGIVGDKIDRWNSWSKGQGGAAGDGGDALYKLIGDAVQNKAEVTLTVKPSDDAIDITPENTKPANELTIPHAPAPKE